MIILKIEVKYKKLFNVSLKKHTYNHHMVNALNIKFEKNRFK
jgi:hypothetical protein